MKNLFITLACMWFTFCLFLIPLIISTYDGQPEDQGLWLRIQNDHYYFGYVGRYNEGM